MATSDRQAAPLNARTLPPDQKNLQSPCQYQWYWLTSRGWGSSGPTNRTRERAADRLRPPGWGRGVNRPRRPFLRLAEHGWRRPPERPALRCAPGPALTVRTDATSRRPLVACGPTHLPHPAW